MDADAFRKEKRVSENVNIIETVGHTPGCVSTLVDTQRGLIALVGDAVIVKEDLLKLRPPSVVTKNIARAVGQSRP